jgi:hypothetical protein
MLPVCVLNSKMTFCPDKGKDEAGPVTWSGTRSRDEGFEAFVANVDVTNLHQVQQLVGVALLSAMHQIEKVVRTEVSSWPCSPDVGKVVKQAAARALEELLFRGPVDRDDLTGSLPSPPPGDQPAKVGPTLEQFKNAAKEGAREGGTAARSSTALA